MDMAERDAFWSKELVDATDDSEHPTYSSLHSLIDWAARAEKSTADEETLRLTAVTLTWFLTTSSRPIRDRATKALTAVLIERPSLFPDLMSRFSTVNDLYVLERLCAAGFGAACHKISVDQLKEAAKAIYVHIFEAGTPPLNLLLRDYCLGIIELAENRNCLPDGIKLVQCRPPYKSDWPLIDVSEEEIDDVVEKAGDKSIYHSSFSFGDFGRYEIDTHIGGFTSVPLTQAVPLNEDQKFELFKDKISKWGEPKRTAFSELLGAYEALRSAPFLMQKNEGEFSITLGHSADSKTNMEQAEENLLALLTDEEQETYQTLAAPNLFSDRVPYEERALPIFDVGLAKRWITKRAYSFGWTKELFPYEPVQGIGRDRPVIERIGKKYQWLALSELMARLTDNVWTKGGWKDEAYVYQHACHADFMRDIEPTILTSPYPINNEEENIDRWWLPKKITFQEEPDEEVARWPFGDRDLHNSPEQIDLEGPDGRRWLVLKSFLHADEKNKGPAIMAPYRRSAFIRISSIIVKAGDADEVVQNLQGQKLTDPTDWEHLDVVDGPYRLEFPWRSTWQGIFSSWNDEGLRTVEGFELVRPVMEHLWESHLDTTLPEGARTAMPSTWLAGQLSLTPCPFQPSAFKDGSGNIVFIDPSFGSQGSVAALIDREIFFNFLQEHHLDCLWVIAGEKMSAPSAGRENLGWRYHSAVYRWKGNKWIGKPWFEDTRRGLGEYDPSLIDTD